MRDGQNEVKFAEIDSGTISPASQVSSRKVGGKSGLLQEIVYAVQSKLDVVQRETENKVDKVESKVGKVMAKVDGLASDMKQMKDMMKILVEVVG